MFRTVGKYAARHGLIRVIGGKAVPALLAWDMLMLANRTRRNPYVDRACARASRPPGTRRVRRQRRVHGHARSASGAGPPADPAAGSLPRAAPARHAPREPVLESAA